MPNCAGREGALMEINLQSYLRAAVHTLRQPSASARYLLALNLSPRVIWLGFVLSVVLTALLATLGAVLLPPLPQVEGTPAAPNIGPFMVIVLIVAAVLINNLAIWQSGKVLGGTARFLDVMVTSTWVSLVMLILQGAHLLVLLILPNLSAITALASVIAMISLSLVFVKEAHGFAAIWQALVTVVLAVMGLAVGLGMLLSFLG